MSAAGGLSAAQQGLLEVLVAVEGERGGAALQVVSEWDGSLPFPVSIGVDGVAPSRFALPWDSGDLEALFAAGLVALEGLTTSSDGLDHTWTVRVTGAGRAAAAGA